MAASWDVFFSYRWHDLDRAQPLLDSLAGAGIRVWRDRTRIPDHESITAEIRHGLANCKAFLAFYSRTAGRASRKAPSRGSRRNRSTRTPTAASGS
jgi:hypothetical protein